MVQPLSMSGLGESDDKNSQKQPILSTLPSWAPGRPGKSPLPGPWCVLNFPRYAVVKEKVANTSVFAGVVNRRTEEASIGGNNKICDHWKKLRLEAEQVLRGEAPHCIAIST